MVIKPASTNIQLDLAQADSAHQFSKFGQPKFFAKLLW